MGTTTSRRGRGLERLGSISIDWWATLLAALVAVLAVANILPRIPW
ncbi:hypothetical protein [Mycobacterium vicinigordonae]|uniref:Uncharacterized protein n=1 Tax=Mycobacterium vicinigordonae TaxID=1719132 RepID=A0A7D6I3W0_9MYCO|nr:hypothetical protein [Mycobacterium vicinigordonae]QLL06318.1 hypothetical protein H0P51_21560 [Mycobacterium vicinigordonae]